MAAASTFDCKLNVQANQDFIDLFVQEMLTSVVLAPVFYWWWRLQSFAVNAHLNTLIIVSSEIGLGYLGKSNKFSVRTKRISGKLSRGKRQVCEIAAPKSLSEVFH